MSTRLERRIVAKTADYTLTPPFDRAGTVFTNAGATAAVTFTLPQPTRAVLGWWYRFKGLAAHNVVVAAPTADTLIAQGDATASTLTLSTGTPDQVGGEIEAACVETTPGVYGWTATGISAHHTFTPA